MLQRSTSDSSSFPSVSLTWQMEVDFCSEPGGGGESGSCRAVLGASKMEELGHKAVFPDSGMEA